MTALTALTEAGFAKALDALAAADHRLAAAIDRHGRPPFWSRPAGFDALVLIILEQQVSLASARACFDRLRQALDAPLSPEGIQRLDDAALRAAGYSQQKIRYTRALADAVLTGELALNELATQPDEAVRAALCALPGIGPWSADVYLLSCLRRPDIWPVGDRALQVAVREVLDLAETPSAGELVRLGERWRPHRSSAAHLLWHAYLVKRGRTLPVE